MAIDYKVIGANIQKRRKELHITQAKMADELFLSVSLISKLERGVKAISLDTFDDIATYLHSSIPELMENPALPEIRHSQMIRDINTMLDDLEQPHLYIIYDLLKTYVKNINEFYEFPKKENHFDYLNPIVENSDEADSSK